MTEIEAIRECEAIRHDDPRDARIAELEGVVRAGVAEAHVISQVATSDPERVKMLAENLVRFMREAIER